LLGPSNLWPKLLEEYTGKTVLCNRLNKELEQKFAKHMNKLKFLNVGWSCANVALAYAAYAGCSPIILIGQDLAYTDGKMHSDESHKGFRGANDASTSDGVMVEDIYGNMVLSRKNTYILFKNFIENIIVAQNLDVIDATEGGAKIIGTKVMTLREVLDTYCTKKIPYHMYDCLPESKGVPSKTYIKEVGGIVQDIKRDQNRLEKLKNKTAKYYRTLETLLEEEKLDGMSETELIEVVKKMEKGNSIIKEIKADMDLKGYFEQNINQAVMRIKVIGNTVTAENVLKVLEQQIVLMAYIHDTCFLVHDEYQKIVDFLEEKLAAKKGEINP
jgi:hypothetical protein